MRLFRARDTPESLLVHSFTGASSASASDGLPKVAYGGGRLLQLIDLQVRTLKTTGFEGRPFLTRPVNGPTTRISLILELWAFLRLTIDLLLTILRPLLFPCSIINFAPIKPKGINLATSAHNTAYTTCVRQKKRESLRVNN
jgi:hypothetical protein